jgi:hypothetical protein
VAAELPGDPLGPDVLIGDVGSAAEGTAAWWRWYVQGGQFTDFLVDDEPWQLIRQVDLLGLKSLAGELYACAMGYPEQFKVGLEYLLRIGRERQKRFGLVHHQERAITLAADLDVRVAGSYDAVTAAEAGCVPRPWQIVSVGLAFGHARIVPLPSTLAIQDRGQAARR